MGGRLRDGGFDGPVSLPFVQCNFFLGVGVEICIIVYRSGGSRVNSSMNRSRDSSWVDKIETCLLLHHKAVTSRMCSRYLSALYPILSP